MIVLLGASGYIGQAFARDLQQRGWTFQPLSRREVDYTRFDRLVDFLEHRKPHFLINAAGFAGIPNVDACESARAETLAGNTLLPATIANACHVAGVPWGHVSSGCIFSGAWVVQDGDRRLERDLAKPEVRSLIDGDPSSAEGFTEQDEPNFTFRRPPCSFYSGAKALGEEMIARGAETYIWRLRIPFDQIDHPKNYLTKIQRYARVYDNLNSLSHRGDFVNACLDLWERRAPFGVYNVTNPGFVSARHVAALIRKFLDSGRQFDFFSSDEEFYRIAAKTPRSNCILDVSKLLSTGVQMRPVEEALVDSLKRWTRSAVE